MILLFDDFMEYIQEIQLQDRERVQTARVDLRAEQNSRPSEAPGPGPGVLEDDSEKQAVPCREERS